MTVKATEDRYVYRALAYQLEPRPKKFKHREGKPRHGHLFKILKSRDQMRWSSFLAWLDQPELKRVAILTADQLLPFSTQAIREVLRNVKQEGT